MAKLKSKINLGSISILGRLPMDWDSHIWLLKSFENHLSRETEVPSDLLITFMVIKFLPSYSRWAFCIKLSWSSEFLLDVYFWWIQSLTDFLDLSILDTVTLTSTLWKNLQKLIGSSTNAYNLQGTQIIFFSYHFTVWNKFSRELNFAVELIRGILRLIGITSYFSFYRVAHSEEKTRLNHILKMLQLKVTTKRGIFSAERQSQGPFYSITCLMMKNSWFKPL